MPITTIPFSDRKAGPFIASAGQTEFPFAFPIYAAGDIDVWRERAGAATLLTLGTDYTVSGAGEQPGGSIVLTSGALADDIIAIDGDLLKQRATSFLGGLPLKASSLDADLNRLVAMAQELAREVGRSVRRAPVDASSGSLVLPQVDQTRLLAIDTTGALLALTTLDTFGSNVVIDEDDNILGVGYLDLTEISEPPSPTANVARLFAQDVDGTTTQAMKDSAGNVVPMSHFKRPEAAAYIRPFSQKLRDHISALDFIPLAEHAAILAGTSTTDVSGYLQEGIDDLSAGNGGVIHFPVGLFVLNSVQTTDDQAASDDALLVLKDKVSLIGAGWHNTVLRRNNASADCVLWLNAGTGRSVERLRIDGNDPTFSTAIHGILKRGDIGRLVLRDLMVHQVGSYGIGLQDPPDGSDGWTQQCTLDNIRIAETGADGIDIKNNTSENFGNMLSKIRVTGWGGRSNLAGQAGIDVRGRSTHLSHIRVSDPYAQAGAGIRFRQSSAAANGSYESTLTQFWVDVTSENECDGVEVLDPNTKVSKGVIFAAADAKGLLIGQIAVDAHASDVDVHGPSGASQFSFEIGNAGAKLARCRSYDATRAYNVNGNNVTLIDCDAIDYTDRGIDIQTVTGCYVLGGRVSSGAGTPFVDDGGTTIFDNVNGIANRDPGKWRVLAKSGVAVSHTGDTNETTLATIAVPAGAMGPNGSLRVTAVFGATGAAATKTGRVRFGGTLYSTGGMSSAQSGVKVHTDIHNRNSALSQVGQNGGGAQAGGWGISTSGPTTSTHNTDSAQNITISGQLANSADTITMEAYTVEICYGA